MAGYAQEHEAEGAAMTATEELRRMLDERGADYRVSATGYSIDIGPYTTAYANRSDTTLDVSLRQVTPEQAIAATLGDEGVGRSNDGVAELGAGTCKKVYLVETSDDLLESWHPLAVYLHREVAEDCAEALRKEEDGIWQFARVSELKVVTNG